MTKADSPQFLKLVYNGPKALEELASFDLGLVVGMLGGGTTRDMSSKTPPRLAN